MNRHVLLTAIVLGITVPGAAHATQQVQLTPEQKEKLAKLEAIEREAQNASPSPEVARKQMLEKVAVLGAKMAVEARTIANAPYSAEALTESTQTLADGNRIVRKTVTRIYRDGEGRTRREQVNENGVVESVSIVDPIAMTSVVLQPETRTAYRDRALLMMPTVEGSSGGGGRGMVRSAGGDTDPESAQIRAKLKLELEERTKAAAMPPPPPPAPGPETRVVLEGTPAGKTVREDLGRQNVEGVAATGSRSTTTIPAGAIGNLQPLKIVSEQWFSPDLQVLVMTKHSDPRTGETTYRLQGIVRAEPDRSLFTVPPDYNLKESRIREPLMK